MPAKDMEWYMQNLPRIQAFEKYITLVRSELPGHIERVVMEAAHEAAEAIDREFLVKKQERPEAGVYWYLPDSYDADRDRGIWIELWLPRTNAAWLFDEAEEAPQLGLWATGGSAERTRELARKAATELRTARPTHVLAADDFEEPYLCIATWRKGELVEELKKWDGLKSRLTRIFREFTTYTHPALKAAQRLNF
jgi:hypothetical protein